jgi:hypothetical protein
MNIITFQAIVLLTGINLIKLEINKMSNNYENFIYSMKEILVLSRIYKLRLINCKYC